MQAASFRQSRTAVTLAAEQPVLFVTEFLERCHLLLVGSLAFTLLRPSDISKSLILVHVNHPNTFCCTAVIRCKRVLRTKFHWRTFYTAHVHNGCNSVRRVRVDGRRWEKNSATCFLEPQQSRDCTLRESSWKPWSRLLECLLSRVIFCAVF